MKKLLYLIPFILIALSVAGISLHKDTVSYKQGADLQSLTPSHWKLQDYSVNASIDLSKTSTSTAQQFKAYTDGAKFYGFPFGAYFTNKEVTGSSSLDISAYSWLWGTVNLLVLLIALLLVIAFNRASGQNARYTPPVAGPQPEPVHVQPPPSQSFTPIPDATAPATPSIPAEPQVIQPQPPAPGQDPPNLNT